MLESLFDLPLLVAGPAIVGALCLYALLGIWIVRRWILPRFRNALIGYAIMFLRRMSFVLATGIFGFVFIMQRPEFRIPVSRYLLLLAGLFAFYCYTQETERLG